MTQQLDLVEIHAQLTQQQAKMVELYHQTLRATMFANRSKVQPAALRGIATAETLALLDFFQESDPLQARQRGEQLCRMGLAEESLWRLTQITTAFVRAAVREDLRPTAMSTLEAYQRGVGVSFIQTRQAIVLEEQERIRSALERTLHHYTVQLEMVTTVSRSTTSILDLDELLQTTVELISTPFHLNYAGIFLVEADNRWAALRAGIGAALQRDHKIEVGDSSLIGQCLAQGQVRVTADVGQGAAAREGFFSPEIHAAAAIPLLLHGKVIGALAAQSQSVAAFADQDLKILQILADQLTITIATSRLFAELSDKRQALERAHQELARTFADLRRAEGWRDDLTNMIVHDLRSPLTTIIANVDLLSRMMSNPTYAEALPRFLTGAQVAGERMIGLIDDLLKVGKFEAGELRPILASLYLPALLIEKAESYYSQAEKDEKTLTIHAPAELPTLMADAGLIGRVIDNLVTNAFKYTDSGGHIEINVAAKDHTLLVQVGDDGPGIPLEHQTRIFDKFVQVTDEAGMSLRRGAGLGLAFCRLAVEAHAGTIWVESQPGQGSTFAFTLPVGSAAVLV